MMPVACLCLAVVCCVCQGKADEWRRAWGLKPSMAYELYIHLANVMKVRGGAYQDCLAVARRTVTVSRCLFCHTAHVFGVSCDVGCVNACSGLLCTR